MKRAVRQAAFFKINAFVLKLEGHFQYKSAPALVEPQALSPSEFQELTDYGLRYYVQVVPYLDAPSHIAFILKHPAYAGLRAFPDSNYEACATNPDTFKLYYGMFQDLLDANKGVKYLYLSTDEAYYIGKADNAQCREVEAARQLGSVGKLLAQAEADVKGRNPDDDDVRTVAVIRRDYDRATKLMRTTAASALNLNDEPATLRDSYGRTPFGQGCLLARRLVERGVPFIEVSLDNWDTHQENFERTRGLCQQLDSGWATLMQDLKDRGLLATTTIIWMGEFGRTPKINEQKGRDHFATAWSTVLAGGGINGGQAIGRTSKDGMTVEERPTTVQDLLGTLCLALGIDYMKTNPSNVGRPIRIVDQNANPVREIL